MARIGGATASLACIVLCGQTAFAAPDLERARVLDQQGVKAYQEGRYNDAIRFFDEAFHVGGPPTELWNVAKCRLRLDDPEGAAREIKKYLGESAVSPSDRAEAEQQLREIEHRPSPVTIASSPAGATVYLDGKKGAPAGVTPTTVEVPPGDHTVTLEHAGYEPQDKSIDARFGRSVIVDAQLSRSNASTGAAATNDRGEATGGHHPHRLILEGELGGQFPHFGTIGGSGNVAGWLAASYVVLDDSRFVASVGARVMLSEDTWGNTVGAPNHPANCGAAIPANEDATLVSAFVDGNLGWRLTSRWRIGGDVGLGIATYSVGDVGGDLFVPSCQDSPGVRPALHLGGSVSYAITRDLRILVSPVMLDFQPAFGGVRHSPKDASGLWLRYGLAGGLAFDLL